MFPLETLPPEIRMGEQFISSQSISHITSIFGKRLSRKSINVVVFPFAFHIAVQQLFKPLWSRLLLCDHEPSRQSTVMCFMSLLMSLLPGSWGLLGSPTTSRWQPFRRTTQPMGQMNNMIFQSRQVSICKSCNFCLLTLLYTHHYIQYLMDIVNCYEFDYTCICFFRVNLLAINHLFGRETGLFNDIQKS
jgi:hypothetical protein